MSARCIMLVMSFCNVKSIVMKPLTIPLLQWATHFYWRQDVVLHFVLTIHRSHFRPRGPLKWLDPGAFGTLGVGGGFALGAKLVRPESEVWVIYGDGSLGYSVAEFDTFTRFKVGFCIYLVLPWNCPHTLAKGYFVRFYNCSDNGSLL